MQKLDGATVVLRTQQTDEMNDDALDPVARRVAQYDLRNGAIRKKFDSLKYTLKKLEVGGRHPSNLCRILDKTSGKQD